MSEVLVPGTVDPHYARQMRRWQSSPFNTSHEVVLLEHLWRAAVFGNDET